jgi:hypothetical protein
MSHLFDFMQSIYIEHRALFLYRDVVYMSSYVIGSNVFIPSKCHTRGYTPLDLDKFSVSPDKSILQYWSESQKKFVTFAPDKIMGTGSFGEVWSFIDSTKTQSIAVKIFLRADNEPAIVTAIQGHAKLTNCSLVNARALPKFIYKGKSLTVVIMNMMSGTLADLSPAMDNPNVMLGVLKKLVDMGNCVSNSGLLYTDYKPANLLYWCGQGYNVEMYFGDLGSLINIANPAPLSFTYPPPEYAFHRNNEPSSKKMVWGIVITFILMFENADKVGSDLNRVVQLANDSFYHVNFQGSFPYRQLILNIINEFNRITGFHKFKLRSGETVGNLLMKMINPDPVARISLADVAAALK